jgi:group I intron endonuclease
MATELNTGIYEIVNRVTGKRYIGSAVHLENRWREHQKHLRRTSHHSRHLQSSWKKHGAAAFYFKPLLLCLPSDLLFFEQRAFDVLKPEYNISPTAGSSLGVRFTKQTRDKIAAKAIGRKRSAESVEAGASKLRGVKRAPERIVYLIGNKHAVGTKHSEEWKRANSERHKGRKHPKSPEYRAKISASLKGIPHSPARRAKQAAAQLGTKRGPYKINPADAERRHQAGAALAAAFNTNRKRKRTNDQGIFSFSIEGGG